MAITRKKVKAVVIHSENGYERATATQDPGSPEYWNIELDGQRFFVWHDEDMDGSLHGLIELLKAVAKEIKKEGK